jgi:hypothetical protein
LNEHLTQNLIREVQKDHWEGSKPPRDTPRTCADRTSDRGQPVSSVVFSATVPTRCRAGKIRDSGAHGTRLIYLLTVDVSSQLPGPGTILGAGALTYHKILRYNYHTDVPQTAQISHIDTRIPVHSEMFTECGGMRGIKSFVLLHILPFHLGPYYSCTLAANLLRKVRS